MKPIIRTTMTTVLLACAGSGFAAAGGVKGPVCIPVDGTVTSIPDLSSCGGNGCSRFFIEGKGKAKFKGVSDVTSVQVSNGSETLLTTPLYFEGTRTNVSVLTANSTLTGKLVTGRSGTLYTEDTITVTPIDGQRQLVAEMLKITRGTDDFDGASGVIAVAGEEIGGAAFYTGQICVTAK